MTQDKILIARHVHRLEQIVAKARSVLLKEDFL